MAAITVAVVLSLVFLAVEKHQRTRHARATTDVSTSRQQSPYTGILLTLDTRLAGDQKYPRTDVVPLERPSVTVRDQAAKTLRRPPEPAANVALAAPVAMVEMSDMPLHANRSSVEYLMDALDTALESPMSVAGLAKPALPEVMPSVAGRSALRLPAPVASQSSIPMPQTLVESLHALRQLAVFGDQAANPQRFIWSRSPFAVPGAEANAILDWTAKTETLLNRLVVEHGLEHPASFDELNALTELADEAAEIGEGLTDYQLAANFLRIGYALERRVAVWKAIQACLDGSTIGLTPARNPTLVRQDLQQAITRVQDLISTTDNAASWNEYLLLDELKSWSDPANEGFSEDGELCGQVLSRIKRPGVQADQQKFLAQQEFRDLVEQLSKIGRDPVDYRQLLSEIEEIERDPISRQRVWVADAVQALRLSSGEPQQFVARTINNHYRNANMRVSVTGSLLERFLPNGDYEVRPVRQRILGADTRGNSAIRTQLSLQLIPDESAWNIGIGVAGNMRSSTRSSKGPATFHNTSTAQIQSARYIRLNNSGYEITAEPTNVSSRDQLRKMSTNFDGLPVFGDFLRLVIREQFDQKRSLAQRVTRRIIAQETDAELNRRLESGLATAQQELQNRLVGPLEKLRLNPIVVDMNTTAERLTIRYRVAGETQLAAHSPRPRAPSDSLLSMQLHESSINNSIAQLGLAGRTWTLEELARRIGEIFGQTDWELPLDVREEVADITVRFADTRPATVEMRDGRLRLTLRVAELSQPGRLHIERFLVNSNYIPYAEGLDAGLVRDGVVEIVSNQGVGERLTLRVIFAKIFVSRSEIPLISESWRDDARSDGLAVSQLDIQDGWLAVAISEAGSALAAGVAQRARELQEQLR